jgi:ATP-dependent protease ClpP protease subunit
MKSWFEFKAQEDPAVAEVHIFGLIGGWIDDFWGDAKERGITTAKTFVEALAALPAAVKLIRLRINSPGGDVFTGLTIANTLRAEQERGRKVETVIDGLAASAASVVAMGGGTIRMADNALMMVHAPWTGVAGNARELRAVADQLDTVRDALVKTYQWHSGKSEDELLALIDGEDGQGSWLDADEAIAAGLATEKVEGLRAAASIDAGAAKALKVPERFAARVQSFVAPAPAATVAPKPMPAVEVMRLCAQAGLDLDFAVAMAADGGDPQAVQARVDAEKQRRVAAAARAKEIRDACTRAGFGELAEEYVAGGMTPAQVKAQLVRITARVDQAVTVDTTLTPDSGTKPKAAVDTRSIYARMNGLQSKE